MGSSGWSTRPGSFSLETMRKVISGASNWRPREFAYLRRMRSRTSSTRSSSLIVIMVAEANGRLTQIFLVTMVPVRGISCSESAEVISLPLLGSRRAVISLVWRVGRILCLLGGAGGRCTEGEREVVAEGLAAATAGVIGEAGSNSSYPWYGS